MSRTKTHCRSCSQDEAKKVQPAVDSGQGFQVFEAENSDGNFFVVILIGCEHG